MTSGLVQMHPRTLRAIHSHILWTPFVIWKAFVCAVWVYKVVLNCHEKRHEKAPAFYSCSNQKKDFKEKQKRMSADEKQRLMGECVTDTSVQLKPLLHCMFSSHRVWLRRNLCYFQRRTYSLNERCKCKHTLGSPTNTHSPRNNSVDTQCKHHINILNEIASQQQQQQQKKRNKNHDYKDVQVIIENSHCRYLCFMCTVYSQSPDRPMHGLQVFA